MSYRSVDGVCSDFLGDSAVRGVCTSSCVVGQPRLSCGVYSSAPGDHQMCMCVKGEDHLAELCLALSYWSAWSGS